MADTDAAIADVYRKIEREKTLINAASNMRQSTSNPAVQGRVDSQIREGRRNIGYLEEKLQELQLKKAGGDGAPPPPAHGGQGYAQQGPGGGRRPMPQGGPTPPPKDAQWYGQDRGDYGDPGPGGYRQGGTGMMPPRAPYGDPRPYNVSVPKARPNYSKLGKSAVHSTVYNITDILLRSHQIRHSIPRTKNSADVVPARIQVVGRETIQGWYREDGAALPR